MPPKSKPTFKKRGGKSLLPAHEYINEQTKESYLVEINELDKRLGRYEVKYEELEAKHKQYQQLFQQLAADQQETVSLYTKTLEQRVDEISDLNDRIIGLQQVADAERSDYERQLQELRTEYKKTKEQLITDNMTMGTQLSQLDEFRLRRAEFSSSLTALQHKLEDQRQQCADELSKLQLKHEHGCQRMKEKMIERLHDVAHEFRKVTNRAMPDTTKRTISENVAIESQLSKMADKTSNFQQDHKVLVQRVTVQQHQMAIQEITQTDLARDYISGNKLIEMLKEKVMQQNNQITQSTLMAEHARQFQLETQVLNSKLAHAREKMEKRRDQHHQLQVELVSTCEQIEHENDKIDELRQTVQTAVAALTRLLQYQDSTKQPTQAGVTATAAEAGRSAGDDPSIETVKEVLLKYMSSAARNGQTSARNSGCLMKSSRDVGKAKTRTKVCADVGKVKKGPVMTAWIDQCDNEDSGNASDQLTSKLPSTTTSSSSSLSDLQSMLHRSASRSLNMLPPLVNK